MITPARMIHPPCFSRRGSLCSTITLASLAALIAWEPVPVQSAPVAEYADITTKLLDAGIGRPGEPAASQSDKISGVYAAFSPVQEAQGVLVYSRPLHGCSPITLAQESILRPFVLVVKRTGDSNCTFREQVR